MCTELLSMAMAAPAAPASTAATSAAASAAAATARTGQAIQAIAGATNALGDLASGVMRARLLRMEAQGERETAAARARRVRAAGERELSRARSDAVAAGVSVRSESVLEAERQITRGVEQDAISSILSGESRARGLQMSADYYRAAGINQLTDGLLGAATKWKQSRSQPASMVVLPPDGMEDR